MSFPLHLFAVGTVNTLASGVDGQGGTVNGQRTYLAFTIHLYQCMHFTNDMIYISILVHDFDPCAMLMF